MRNAPALLTAVFEGDIDECRALIAAGADINDGAQFDTPLHLAARDGKLEICRLLIAAGAPLEPFDYEGLTPLARAAHEGHVEVCEFLIDAGASPYLSGRAGADALTHAYNFGDCEKTCAVLNTLLAAPLPEARAAMAQVVAAKASALRNFAVRGRSDAPFKLLIDAGADINLEDHEGWTPLLSAAANNKVNICKALIAAGADISLAGRCQRTSPLTPFQIAVASGATNVVTYFIEHHGADCAQRSPTGRTMAQLAGKHSQMQQLLKAAKTAQLIGDGIVDAGAGPATAGSRRGLAL